MPVEISVAEMYAMGIAEVRPRTAQILVALSAHTNCAKREEVITGAMTKVAEETQQLRQAQ